MLRVHGMAVHAFRVWTRQGPLFVLVHEDSINALELRAWDTSVTTARARCLCLC